MADEAVGISADDVKVALAVREDLGMAHEPEVIADFLDRLGGQIDQRVDERVAAQRVGRSSSLPIVSLALGIPITAIASANGPLGVALAWAGIAAVNLADALRR